MQTNPVTTIRSSSQVRFQAPAWSSLIMLGTLIGTYTYPICFMMPTDLPPSVDMEYGKFAWELKASAHRPGAFKSKLATRRVVRVERNPLDEHSSSITTFERQWEEQVCDPPLL